MGKSANIVAVTVSLLLIGILLPIGLNDILGFTSSNSTIETLINTVIPILAVVGIIMQLARASGGSN